MPRLKLYEKVYPCAFRLIAIPDDIYRATGFIGNCTGFKDGSITFVR